MIYIDKLLLTIMATQREALIYGVSVKDHKTLSSLASSVTSDQFITENQSKLILKLLAHYSHTFGDMATEIKAALADPKWSRTFRVIEQVRKLYIDTRFAEHPMLSIEFTFSTNIRKILTQANKTLDGLIQDTNGKLYHTELTEHNIVTLVELLNPLGFVIDEAINRHYELIKSWDKEEVKKNYLYSAITTRNYETCIANDIGNFNLVDDVIKQDRSLRYRYFTDTVVEDDGTLTRKIATRGKNRVWVNKKLFSLDNVVASLVELKRLPVLVVFDSYNQSKSADILQELSTALVNNNVSDNVGVYFRLPNTDTGMKFNKIIAENSYNKFLATDTQVVCVQSNKIPKFLLSTTWTPMSVIVIETNLRSSKTAVYANGCDLIITYSDEEPLYDKTENWA
jgi:hypothetical protein